MLSNFKALPRFIFNNKIMGYGSLNLSEHIKTSKLIQNTNKFNFSSFFNEMDSKDINAYSAKKYQNKRYRDLIDMWKRPL